MIDKQMKDRLWDTFKSAVKRNATPQQYKNFVRKFDKKYIDHYHSRVVNPEVLRYLFKDGEPTGSYKKLIAKELRKDAVIKAANKNLKPGTKPYKQFIKNYIEKRIRFYFLFL
jgi:type III secretory pathway component EscR